MENLRSELKDFLEKILSLLENCKREISVLKKENEDLKKKIACQTFRRTI